MPNFNKKILKSFKITILINFYINKLLHKLRIFNILFKNKF